MMTKDAVYVCTVCGVLNSYWPDYCQAHENQVDAEVDDAVEDWKAAS